MNPKKITSEILKENYFYMKHPSGLDIYVYPKKDYNSKYAIIGSNFGSINNKFKLKNELSYTNIPDGDRKSTRLNSSHPTTSRMPSSA